MICPDTAAEVQRRRKAFLSNRRLECQTVADGLDEAGARVFAFNTLHPSR